MRFEFNKETTESQKTKIRSLVNAIKTQSANDLLFRVVFLKPHKFVNSKGQEEVYYKTRSKHGYYKNLNDHGFYNSEWGRVFVKKDCKHIIQLFLTPKESEESITRVIAHEWRHYIQFTKKRDKYVRKNGHLEVDARKWSKERVQKLIASRIIKPEYNDAFTYYRFQQAFEEMFK